MLPLLAPILAQLVTLNVGDRTEARLVDQAGRRWEASTTPGVELAVRYRRSDSSISYVPSFTLTPLEHEPREVLVFHQLNLSTSYRFKLTTLNLNSNLGFGQINYLAAALRAQPDLPNGAPDTPAEQPAPDGADPGATPQPVLPDPTTGLDPQNPNVDPNGGPAQQAQIGIVNRTVRQLTWTTTLSATSNLSKEVSLNVYSTYSEQRGLDKISRATYPKQRGIAVGATVSHLFQLYKRDAFTSSLSVQQIWSFNGSNVAALVAREDWTHVLTPHASSNLGAGLSITRFSQPDGTIGFSIFPTLLSGLGYQAKVAHGLLNMSVGAYAQPVLDPLRATVDPRVGVGSAIGWTRERFSTSLSGDAALSVADAQNDAAAIDTFNASYIAAYNVVDRLIFDVGARGTALSFRDTAAIPPSWAIFAGVSFGHAFLLSGRH